MIDYGMGVGPLMLEGPGTNSAGSLGLVEIFQSPLLDLTQTYSNIELVPARPNLVPYPTDLAGPGSWLIEKLAGVQTSPPTIRAGSDAGHQNFILTTSTTPSNANFNASAAAPCISSGPNTGVTSGTLKRIPNTPILFDLTSPAAGTGGYICLARYFVAVMWIAVGQ